MEIFYSFLFNFFILGGLLGNHYICLSNKGKTKYFYKYKFTSLGLVSDTVYKFEFFYFLQNFKILLNKK